MSTVPPPAPRRYYLAGPMRGIKEFNFPTFLRAAERLRGTGHLVMSPAEHDLEIGFSPQAMTGNEDLASLGFDLRASLLWDVEQILHPRTSGVVFLPGWENSTGARAEFAVNKAVGGRVGYYHESDYLEMVTWEK